MNPLGIFWKTILGSSLLCILTACGTLLHQPIQVSPARLGEETQSTIELKSLPLPKDKIVVAVYKFRDQTGQYKPTENGTSWSTAVTQGATSILLKALEDSRWFIPIERENVSNLLNERKIIRSSRAQYNTNDQNNQALLPPLLYAGVILEGGIISYDANVITGGAGLRYFGAGGSSQYRQDRITVYIRAISTSNGKILKTVYTSKTILSQALDAGIFRYVRFGRLLEAETGFTYNEPSEVALTEAIEKAVFSLVVEGIKENLWELNEAREIVAQPILDYEKEKKKIPQTDIFGNLLDNRRKAFGLSMSSASLQYKGDYPDPVINTGLAIGLHYSRLSRFDFSLNYGLSRLGTKKFYQADVSYLDLSTAYRFAPYDLFTPYLSGGLGLITENRNNRFDWGNRKFPKAHIGGGFEFLINDNIGIKASIDYNYLFNDEFDAIDQGKYNDFFWRGNLGLQFYFGEKIKSKRKFNYEKTGER
ncbi:MAG: CsgG/HfaB family protein [Bacteroidota bacterium]